MSNYVNFHENIQNHSKVFNKHCTQKCKSHYRSLSHSILKAPLKHNNKHAIYQAFCKNPKINSIIAKNKAIATNIKTKNTGQNKVTRKTYQFTINPNTNTEM